MAYLGLGRVNDVAGLVIFMRFSFVLDAEDEASS
jgi:hypothetical protein